MNDYSSFLKDVESLNEKYASIYVNCELEPLAMPFWSWQHIQESLSLRAEWEVDDSLVPFYGDWHDLFCLNIKTGEVVALNDEREEVCKWATTRDFLSSLSVKEIEFDDELHVSGDLFSPDHADNGLKKKH